MKKMKNLLMRKQFSKESTPSKRFWRCEYLLVGLARPQASFRLGGLVFVVGFGRVEHDIQNLYKATGDTKKEDQKKISKVVKKAPKKEHSKVKKTLENLLCDDVDVPVKITCDRRLQRNLKELQRNEVFEWLRQVCNLKDTNIAIKRLGELSNEIKTPCGVTKIKKQIKFYLKAMPSQFSADDKYGQSLRRQLPNYIVRKLKNFFMNQQKNAVDMRSLVYSLKYCKKKNSLKSILKSWAKSLPINSQEDIDITKGPFFKSFLQSIKQLILSEPENNEDFKHTLKSTIAEIVQKIPLIKTDDKFIAKIVNNLADMIEDFMNYFKPAQLNHIMVTSNSLSRKNEGGNILDLKNIISEEITRLFEDSDVVMENNLKKYIIKEFVKSLSTIQSPGTSKDDKIISEMCYLLQFGRTPQLQAIYISEEMLKIYKNSIFNNINKSKKLIGHCSETCVTFYNPIPKSDPEHNIGNEAIANDYLRAYFNPLSIGVEDWLLKFKDHLPMIKRESFRKIAVRELVNMMMFRLNNLRLDRFQYIDRESPPFEAEQMRLLIFKWIRKITFENYNELLKHVPELMTKIHNLPISALKSVPRKSSPNSNKSLRKKLYKEIFFWYNQLPYTYHINITWKLKHLFTNVLIEGLIQAIHATSVEETVEKEVSSWASKVLKDTPTCNLADLKAKIRNMIEKKPYKTETTQLMLLLPKSKDNCEKLDINHRIQREIIEWIRELTFLKPEDMFKRDAIKNLIIDIKSRRKYLNLNLLIRPTEESELENLKYQVFKWLERSSSEDNSKLLANVPQLMQRLKNIFELETNKPCSGFSVGVNNKGIHLTKSSVEIITKDNIESKEKQIETNVQCNFEWSNNNLGQGERYAGPICEPSCSAEITSNVTYYEPINNLLHFGINNCSTTLPLKTKSTLKFDKKSKPRAKRKPVELPVDMSLTETYEYFDEIFIDRCNEIPLAEMKTEQGSIGHVTKEGIYNAIWKSYFRLKSDPSIEYNTALFEELLENQLNLLLECLPKSKKLESTKASWKKAVIEDVMTLLNYVHNSNNTTSYRDKLIEQFNRHFIRQFNLYLTNKIQPAFTAQTVNAYILSIRYKDCDPDRADVYNKRFIARLEELQERLKHSREVDFQWLDIHHFYNDVYKVFQSVPLPTLKNIEDEADEILIRDEVENWYNELPVLPVLDDTENLVLNQYKEVLSKNLYSIERNFYCTKKINHEKMATEIILFLGYIQLQPDQVSNVKLIAEDLIKRIWKRHNQVLRENTVKQPINQSLNNTAMCSTKCHDTVMTAFLSQKANIFHKKEPNEIPIDRYDGVTSVSTELFDSILKSFPSFSEYEMTENNFGLKSNDSMQNTRALNNYSRDGDMYELSTASSYPFSSDYNSNQSLQIENKKPNPKAQILSCDTQRRSNDCCRQGYHTYPSATDVSQYENVTSTVLQRQYASFNQRNKHYQKIVQASNYATNPDETGSFEMSQLRHQSLTDTPEPELLSYEYPNRNLEIVFSDDELDMGEVDRNTVNHPSISTIERKFEDHRFEVLKKQY